MHADAFVTAAMLALAVGAVAFTITSSKISAPLRTAVVRRSLKRKRAKGKPGIWGWFSDLLACPFCVAHWLSFVAVGLYRPWLVKAEVAPGWVGGVADYLVTCLAVVVAAMVAVRLIKIALAGTSEPSPPAATPTGHARWGTETGSSRPAASQRTQVP